MNVKVTCCHFFKLLRADTVFYECILIIAKKSQITVHNLETKSVGFYFHEEPQAKKRRILY